ncbi:HEXXH motif-containing protein [Thermomonospora echinospora]|uniref:HEXXH motif-containing protein n=1 Tax=Thermomonospora echinospora TaxID=1992 RepID=A0A1H5XWL9_9ACTN|nr:HEXXH motif domain-containing protein [Thermomonospora echinospora]SEG16164.1 HEXXH motif-containing protein [Thermomonospora echinospora]
MSLGRHSVPEKAFLALAAGSGGADALEHLKAAQRSKHLLLIRAVRDTALEAGHPEAHQAGQAYRLLADIERTHPDQVRTVLAYPTVGAWARRTLLALTGDGNARKAAHPGELTALAAAAAIRAGHSCAVEVPVRDGAVVLPSLGRAPLPGQSTALVRSRPGRAEVTAGGTTVRVPGDHHEDGPGWEALRRLSAEWRGTRVDFLLDDHDPDRAPGADPVGTRLDARELEHWRETLGRAWRMLLSRHWTTAEEVAASITVLTPLVPPEQGQSSATPKHAFGNVGLSTPPDAHFFAVTLAHEVQHTKLTALLDVVRLVRPDDGSRYYAPWREDPRPPEGLLQGAYAHLGITGFWRRQRDHESGDRALRAHSDFARWREATELGARTLLASGRLTPAGKVFVTEMRRTLRPWLREPVSAPARERARRVAEDHLSRWRLRNGEPPLPAAL